GGEIAGRRHGAETGLQGDGFGGQNIQALSRDRTLQHRLGDSAGGRNGGVTRSTEGGEAGGQTQFPGSGPGPKSGKTGHTKCSLKRASHAPSYTGETGRGAKYQRKRPALKKRSLFSWCFWVTAANFCARNYKVLALNL